MRNCLKCPAYRVNPLLMAECAAKVPERQPELIIGLGCRLDKTEIQRAMEELEDDEKR